MNQDQQVDNDLQKAIDDITNTTNSDPVFADPVAAPSSIPEGDTGEMAEPIGPFPAPKVEMITPATDQMAPLDPINIPDLPIPDESPAPEPKPEPEPEPTPEPEPEPEPTPEPEPISTNVSSLGNSGLSVYQIKEAALRDLIPLIDKLNVTPTQSFNLYRDIFEVLRDYTVLESAYHAAQQIKNEHEQAEALLYVVEAIDKM